MSTTPYHPDGRRVGGAGTIAQGNYGIFFLYGLQGNLLVERESDYTYL